MSPRKQGTAAKNVAEPFLRSINIQYDAEEPERIRHFQPTTKTVTLLNALLGKEDDRACFVVAPYGSGKSLTGAYLLHLVENREDSESALREIERRLRKVSPELARFAARRHREGDEREGMVIALQGHQESLPQALKEATLTAMRRMKLGREARAIVRMNATTMEQAVELLSAVKMKAVGKGFDRIVVLWDEFGRHVETLVTSGRAAELNDIQLLAEFAARSTEIPMTLGLLLHQGLLQYASNVPQSVRAEWTKIEGRFRTIQYIDDSREIYRLIAEVAESRRDGEPPKALSFKELADSCTEHGLFREFEAQDLPRLLEQAYPLEPVTLFLLPRIAARVAQNERTLFSFLYATDLSEVVSPSHLYDYFSSSMRADTAVGGTYRQWLETESALAKVAGDQQATDTLKTACLLAFGTSGERTRVSRSLLAFAACGSGGSDEAASLTVEGLVDKKLLLYRKHNDDVSIWHGTDADLRGRLEEEKHSLRAGFEILDYLRREAQPRAWKPVEYNAKFGIERYFVGEYQDLERLEAYLRCEIPILDLPPDLDGKIVFLVAEQPEDLERAEKLVKEELRNDRVVFAMPREPLRVTEAALEAAALVRMQMDSELVGNDPLVLPELQQMADDARNHLQNLLDRLLLPGPNGPRWFWEGKEMTIESPQNLRRALSRIAEEVYPYTPRINNELIVRKKPSPIVVNARKKLVLGILERYGQEKLGLKGDFPDSSMFRTVLLHTGLYHENGNSTWCFAPPSRLKDRGLREVWSAFHDLFTTPSDKAKDLKAFFDGLTEPPIGLRRGLLPIFFAAALRAFPAAISLSRKGEYLTDILPSDVEALCKTPEEHRLQVLDLDEERFEYLHGVHDLFATSIGYEVPDNDLIRSCFDAIESWKAQLPEAALSSKVVSGEARRFQRVLAAELDPVQLLLNRIPGLLSDTAESNEPLGNLKAMKAELEQVVTIYAKRASDSLRRTLALGRDTENAEIQEIAKGWSECFPDTFIESLTDGVAKGLLVRMRTPYRSEEALLNSLSSLLVGRALTRWDDSTPATFERSLQDVVHRVEDAALSAGAELEKGSDATRGLAELIAARIENQTSKLVALIGSEQASHLLSKLLRSQTIRGAHGND